MVHINRSFEVDLQKATVKDLETNNVYRLGTNEVELMKYFLCQPDKLLSKKELIDNIWTKRGVIVEESSLMNALSTCRKAFGEKAGDVIKTERGKGYRFIGYVESLSANEEESDAVALSGNQVSSEPSNQLLFLGMSFDLCKKNWLTYYLASLLISIGLGYLTSFVIASYQENTRSKSFAYDSFEKCLYENPTTLEVINLAPAKVVTANGISIAYNERYQAFSFPNTLLEQYCG